MVLVPGKWVECEQIDDRLRAFGEYRLACLDSLIMVMKSSMSSVGSPSLMKTYIRVHPEFMFSASDLAVISAVKRRRGSLRDGESLNRTGHFNLREGREIQNPPNANSIAFV